MPWQDYSFNNPTRFTVAGTEERARERRSVIEPSTPTTLQIDIDGEESYARYNEMIELWGTCPTLPALGRVVERPSRTPGHKHITIEITQELTVEGRILMQTLLGSDLKRELLTLASHFNGHPNPICFYRPRQEVADAVETPESRDGAVAAPRARRPRRRRRNVGVVGQPAGRSFDTQSLDDLFPF